MSCKVCAFLYDDIFKGICGFDIETHDHNFIHWHLNPTYRSDRNP